MSLFLFPILSFCKFEFYFNNNNLYIRLSFHFTYDNDEETIDFEIYLSIISNNVILMSLYPRIFKWFFDIYIYIYIYIMYIYIYLYIYTQHVYIYIYTHTHTYIYIIFVNLVEVQTLVQYYIVDYFVICLTIIGKFFRVSLKNSFFI